MIDLTTLLISPESAECELKFNVGTATSPFTGGVQVTDMPGAHSVLKYSYSNLSLDQARIMTGIVAVLKGGADIAHIRDYSHVPRYDQPKGTPVVAGANQSGSTLKLSGFNPNADIFMFGDKLSYMSTDGLNHLHTVIDVKVESDASGNATVKISPPLHNPPVDGSYVETVRPIVSVRRTDTGSTKIDGVVSSLDLEFTEAIYGLD